MKKLILSLSCLALATPAWAQNPTVVSEAPVVPVHHAFRGPACQEPCPASTCVAVPTTIKTTRTVFASKCIEYCLPKCTLGGGDCCTNCGPVRTKHVLMKKVVTDECPGTKCEVQPGCIVGAVRVGQAMPATVPVATAPVATVPAAGGEPVPFVGQRMPQAAVTPR